MIKCKMSFLRLLVRQWALAQGLTKKAEPKNQNKLWAKLSV